MGKQTSSRKPLVVGIIAAVVILAALLALLLTQCAPGGSGVPNATTTEGKPVIENTDLYWNIDRALYDGMSEGGMSSRRAGKDGYFHIRFFKNGEFVELKAETRAIVNKLEVRDLMGLVLDGDLIVDVIPIEDMPVQKVGWKFYVQSVGGHVIKVNSSNKFDGLEVLLEAKGDCKVYDMTGTMGEVGCETTAVMNDRVMAVADLDGNLLAVYIYDRSNMIVEFQAHCQHCDQEVTWQEWDNEKQAPVAEGHYKLVKDVQLSGQKTLPSDAKVHLDLNGHTIHGKAGARVYSIHSLNSELVIMDTSEEQNGRLAAHGEIYAQGCVVWGRSGNFYLYSGILDASDAQCTGLGGAAVYIAAERFFYMYGGEIIGGTAKCHFNENNGQWINGVGGSLYVAGKFVMKDGVIRDGKALSTAVWTNGKASYKRGLGGNLFVRTGGEVVIDGGVIKNGVAGAAGNIYLDGTAEFTLNAGTITGGRNIDPGREGGNVNMAAKSTFNMNGGIISNGTTSKSAGNVYMAGTFVMQGGLITGGRALDAEGKVDEKAVAANMFLSTGSKLLMYGGAIHGRVAATDGNAKDGKHTTIVLAGMPTIYDEKAPSNLTLQVGAEPVRVQVNALTKFAKIGISAGGKFTEETQEANCTNFVSDIEGAEVLYVDKCLAVGKMACLCGSETKHIGDCDGKELLWAPWISSTTLPTKEGNYFLVNDITYSGNRSIGASDTQVIINLDLNGKTISSDQRTVTSYADLSIADHVGGGKIIGAGPKSGKDHTGTLLVFTDRKLNIYGGTIALADQHNTITYGGALGIAAGAVVNVYDGVLDGRANSENKIDDGAVARVDGTLNIYGGKIYGGTVAKRGGAFLVQNKGALNVLGGEIEGGNAANGGTAYLTGKNASITVSGGIITGGTATSRGGNFNVASGTFTLADGKILDGSSTGNGGNISATGGEVVVSGGLISGGKVKDSESNHTANIVIQNSAMEFTGGQITGGMLVLNSTEENKASIVLSGEPVVTRPDVYGLRLLGVAPGAEPDLTISGKLGEKASIALDANEVFTTETVAENGDKFIPADEQDTIHFGEDKCLFVGRIHCLCENGKADWCDHKQMRWSKWDGKTNLKEGNYYLATDVKIGKPVALGEKGKDLNICLNGHAIESTKGRVMQVYGNVNIFDHSEGKGAMIGVGNPVKETEKDGVVTKTADHSAVAVVYADAQLCIYGGTYKLGENFNQCNDMGGVMAVGAGAKLNIYGGIIDATASLTSETTIGAGGAIRVDGELNVFGGQIIGGKVTGNGGAILLRSATAVVNVTGGRVIGGEAKNGGAIYVADGSLTVSGGTVENGAAFGTGKGGNIMLAGGSLTISGGEVKGGAASQGGNIAVQATGATIESVTISGGTISGGKAGASNNANLYVNNAILKLSGGKIDGGVTVVRTATGKSWVEISGNPEIKATDKTNLRLVGAGGTTAPEVKIIGKLTGGENTIGITAPVGLFATGASEEDAAVFFDDSKQLQAVYMNEALYLGQLRCLCGEATHTEWCDSTMAVWLPWNGTTNLKEGNYYLSGDAKIKKNLTIGEDGKTLNISLDGHTITAENARVMHVYGKVNIVDHGEGEGMLIGSGLPVKKTEKYGITLTNPEHTAVALVFGGAELNLYGGTVKLAENYNPMNNGGLISVAADGVVNLMGATVDASESLKSETTKIENGAAFRVSGELNIISGEIIGGKAYFGGAIYVTGGTVNMTGGVVRDGQAWEGGNIRIQAEGKFNFIDGVIEGGTADSYGGNVSLLTGGFNQSGGKLLDGITDKQGGNIAVAINLARPLTKEDQEEAERKQQVAEKEAAEKEQNKQEEDKKEENKQEESNKDEKPKEPARVILNISGGTISGGNAKDSGGNIIVGKSTVDMTLSGGIIEGGVSGNKGGNIMVSAGKLIVSAGTVKNGQAKQGGNIAAQLANHFEVAGGTIAGGKADADNNANLYVNNTVLKLSGGKIDGGVTMVITATDKAWVELSGAPEIKAADKTNLRLVGISGAVTPEVKIVGKLTGGENTIGITAPIGAFASGASAEDAKIFFDDSKVMGVAYDNTQLYLGQLRCLCGAASGSVAYGDVEHTEWCDTTMGKCLWQAWDGKTALKEGNYYLSGDATIEKYLTIGEEGKTLNISLDGHTITAEDTRVIQIYGNVNIVDHGEGEGMLIGTGLPVKEIEKDGKKEEVVEHSAVAIVYGKATLNLYAGTLKLAENHNKLSDLGGVMAIASGAVVNIYDGKVDASASLNSDKTIAAGGAIRVDGELNVYGGQIIGGKVTGNGGAILLRSETAVVNIFGGTIRGGQAKGDGGNICVKTGSLNISNAVVENGIAGTERKGGNIFVAADSKASLTIGEGAQILGGIAKQGGNIGAMKDSSVVISGGTISGGTATQGSNSANIYVNNIVLKLSGGVIDGGISVVRSDDVETGVELSGNVRVNATDKTNIRLVKTGSHQQPVITIVGALTGEAGSISITAPVGTVAVPGQDYVITEADKAVLKSDVAAERLRFAGTDLESYVAHLHCWCENAASAPEHTCDDAQEWNEISATSTLEDGYYYLTKNVSGAVTVSAGKTAYLCLNGKQLKAQTVTVLGDGATLYICDCGTTGEITTTKNSLVKIADGQSVYLMNGKLNGTNAAVSSRIAVEMTGGTFYMYGGQLVNGCANVANVSDATKKETAAGKGGNLYITGGNAYIFDGIISGGKLGAQSCDVILKDGSLTVGGNTKIGNVQLAEGKTLAVSAENALTGTGVIGISVEKAPVIGQSSVVVTGAASADAFFSVDSKLELTYENSEVRIQVKTSNFENKTLKYDDRKELKTWLGLENAPTSVIISSQVVKSTQVGGASADENVLAYENGVLYAVGTGTAVLMVDGVSYNVTVEPAKLSVFMITGHSLAVGQYGDANKSLVVEAGQAYSTYAANMDRKSEADVEALIDPNGGLGFGAADRAGATLDAFAPGQGGTTGEGSAIASSWIANTGEKVWILNAARGGSSINSWVPSTTNTGYENIGSHDLAVALFLEAQQVLQREIAAGHYTLGDMAVIYHNGGNFSTSNGLKDQNGELTFTWDQLKSWYDAMWNSYQTNFNKDIDGDGVVDTIKLAISNGGYSQNYDLPLGYYLGVTDPNMSTVLENYAKWKEDLSTFPTPNYEVQDGSQVKAPESHKHTAMGGTSDNSFYCDRDNTHLSQVAYNAMGLDVAANLYGALRGNRTLTAVEVRDSAWQQPTDVTLRIGQSWIYALVGTPYYGTGATVEATGAVAVDPVNPWIVHANEAGEGKLIVKVGTTVMKEVTFTVGDSHKHCWCVGADVIPAGHTCNADTKWTAIAKQTSSKTTLENGGHYFLDWSGSSAQSLIVPDNAQVYICLNGATIYASQALTIGNGATVNICDCSAEKSGLLTVSGSASTPVIPLAADKTATVNFYSGNITGSYNSKTLQCVSMEGAGQVFNMYGGTIYGGVSTDRGGNVYIVGGTMNIFGGLVENGIAGAEMQGGNIFVSAGSLNVRGGKIQGGNAQQGGNIAVYTGVIEISGGTISGGTATQNSNNANIYVNNSVLKLSGGTIDGGVSVINTTGTQAWVELSGNPRIMATDKTNLRLHKTGGELPVVKIMGALTGEAGSIGITMANAGVFAVPGNDYVITETDKAVFKSDKATELVDFDGVNLKTYLPHMHCWCEGAEAAPAHTCAATQVWEGITATKTIGNGYYYLNWSGSKAASITVKAGEHAHLCLNGAMIYATKTITLGEGSTLSICDCKGGGVIGVSGAATRSPILIETNAVVNLYSGFVTGRYVATKSFAAVTVTNADGQFNMYGGKLYCKLDGDVSGGNLTLTDGKANILGGTIEAGTNADSYAVDYTGGELTIGGNVKISSVKLAAGKTIAIASPLTCADQTIGLYAGQGLFATGAVEADAAKFKNLAGTKECPVYVAEGQLHMAVQSCLCGAASGNVSYTAVTHTDWCEASGQKLLLWQPWDGTTVITNGNYYLTKDNAQLNVGVCEQAATDVLNLCLNGKTVSHVGSTRAFNVKGTMNITDWSATSGAISGKGKANDQSAVALVNGGTLNLYRGTLKLADDHNVLGGFGGVMAVAGGGTINIYEGGCVDASASLTSGKAITHAAAIRVSANLNIIGGTVIGGKVDSLGGAIYIKDSTAAVEIRGGTVKAGDAVKGDAICFANGSLTLSGNVNLGEIYVAAGKAITLKDNLTTAAPIAIQVPGDGVFAKAEAGKTLTYAGKSRFVASDSALNVACYAEGYAITAAPVFCDCGKAEHDATCTQLDLKILAWVDAEGNAITDKLPTTSGNYYLTAPVAVSATATVNADQDVKLWLQGKDVTVKTGEKVTIIYQLDNGAKLTLADTKGASAGTIYATVDGNHIVRVNKGELVIDGAKLDASATVFTAKGLNGTAIYANEATVTMKRGTVTGGTTTHADSVGGSVYLATNATMYMQDGLITGGTATNGGNVALRGKFYMSGGEISGGIATKTGGNIYTFNAQTTYAEINGGSITGGSAAQGGGVSAYGAFKLLKGTISGGNCTDKGGNIYIHGTSNASVTIEGGVVTGGKKNNAATDRGNIAAIGGTLKLLGGEIHGGIFAMDGAATLQASGAPKVDKNLDTTGMATNDFVIAKSSTSKPLKAIEVIGEFTGEIYVEGNKNVADGSVLVSGVTSQTIADCFKTRVSNKQLVYDATNKNISYTAK